MQNKTKFSCLQNSAKGLRTYAIIQNNYRPIRTTRSSLSNEWWDRIPFRRILFPGIVSGSSALCGAPPSTSETSLHIACVTSCRFSYVYSTMLYCICNDTVQRGSTRTTGNIMASALLTKTVVRMVSIHHEKTVAWNCQLIKPYDFYSCLVISSET